MGKCTRIAFASHSIPRCEHILDNVRKHEYAKWEYCWWADGIINYEHITRNRFGLLTSKLLDDDLNNNTYEMTIQNLKDDSSVIGLNKKRSTVYYGDAEIKLVQSYF